jgi:predicted aldo/keto reductase-like oxidoreductase
MDGVKSAWGPDSAVDVNPVLEQIKAMHEKGHGVIGMKIFGNGDFKNPDDREKSIRFAMSKPEINAIVIGFTAPEQVNEAIERINRILAET